MHRSVSRLVSAHYERWYPLAMFALVIDGYLVVIVAPQTPKVSWGLVKVTLLKMLCPGTSAHAVHIHYGSDNVLAILGYSLSTGSAYPPSSHADLKLIKGPAVFAMSGTIGYVIHYRFLPLWSPCFAYCLPAFVAAFFFLFAAASFLVPFKAAMVFLGA